MQDQQVSRNFMSVTPSSMDEFSNSLRGFPPVIIADDRLLHRKDELTLVASTHDTTGYMKLVKVYLFNNIIVWASKVGVYKGMIPLRGGVAASMTNPCDFTVLFPAVPVDSPPVPVDPHTKEVTLSRANLIRSDSNLQRELEGSRAVQLRTRPNSLVESPEELRAAHDPPVIPSLTGEESRYPGRVWLHFRCETPAEQQEWVNDINVVLKRLQ